MRLFWCTVFWSMYRSNISLGGDDSYYSRICKTTSKIWECILHIQFKAINDLSRIICIIQMNNIMYGKLGTTATVRKNVQNLMSILECHLVAKKLANYVQPIYIFSEYIISIWTYSKPRVTKGLHFHFFCLLSAQPHHSPRLFKIHNKMADMFK